MVNEVTITGFGGRVPTWATEDTLQRLTDLTQVQVQAIDKGFRLDSSESKRADKRNKQLSKNIDKSLQKSKGVLNKSLEAFLRSTIIGGASFETMFKRFGQTIARTITDWVTKVPLVGIVLAPLIISFTQLNKIVQQALASFNELYDTGLTMNGSFITLIQVAGAARIGLFELVDALKGHSESITRMSTGNLKGVQAFGALYESVRDNIRINDFFGMSIGETSEFLGTYLDTLKIAGNLQKLDEIARGTAVGNYIREITRLAHFTGKRRKQVQEEVEAVMRKESIAAALAGMSAESQIEARKFLGLASAYGPTVLQAAEEIILTGATGFSEGTRGFTALMPDVAVALTEMGNNVKKGNKLTIDEQGKFVVLYNKLGTQLVEAQGPNLGYLISQSELLRAGFEGALRARNLTEENFKKDLAFQESLTKLYQNWEQIWQDFISRFTDMAAAFLKIMEENGALNRVFSNLQTLLESVNVTLEEWVNQGTMETLIKSIGKFSLWIIDWVSGMTGMKDLPEDFETPLDVLGDKLGELIDKLVVRFEYYMNRMINKITPFGIGGTSKSFEEWQAAQEAGAEAKAEYVKRQEELGIQRQKDVEEYQKLGYARGGIARVPSVFGEAGPEVAIPLTTGDRIPVAEVKRSATEMKTFEDIRMLLEDIKERIEWQANEASSQTSTLKQIERKAGKDPSRIF